MSDQNLLTAAQLAERLGFKRQTIYNRLSLGGDLPRAVYLGRTPRWRPSDIEAWLSGKVSNKPSDLLPAALPKRRPGRPTKSDQILRRLTGPGLSATNPALIRKAQAS